jgi:nucleotide-binding universal stress UspA family protein
MRIKVLTKWRNAITGKIRNSDLGRPIGDNTKNSASPITRTTTMYKHILIATDGSEYSDLALAEGFQLATALKSAVTVVTAVQTPEPIIVEDEIIGPDLHERKEEARQQARSIFASALKIAAQVGVSCQTECVLDETPYDAIIQTAQSKGCDLIVMASHGRSGIKALLLGSETQKVLTRSAIPVLVHRR